jgi:uncharacterized protein YecT (DUF1311 family)
MVMLKHRIAPARHRIAPARHRIAPAKHRIALSFALAGALLLGLCAQGGAAVQHSKLSAPVIHEDFTLLPCTGRPSHRTTLQLEGCGEHTVLRWDAQIDSLNAMIFKNLPAASAREQFITGHDAWLNYRRRYCLSAAAPDDGGTLAGVIYIDCVAAINDQHVKELKSFLKSLRSS